MQVISYQVSDNIDLKLFKTAFTAGLYFSDSEELFFKIENERFISVFKYGVVSFLNYDEAGINSFLKIIAPFCKNRFTENLSEEFTIETGAKENKIGYNKIDIVKPNIDVYRLIMLNVSQSVALDYYMELTTKLLEETNYHTERLEKAGKLLISGRNLTSYIGKTLLLKNRILENLYIFDSPPETWEDESLNKIDMDLKRTFEIQERFRHISEGLRIVKENLELFKDILQYRNSNFLEWIVIALIAVEVINLIIEKLFH